MSGPTWDKVLPLINTPSVGDRDGMRWGDLKQSHVGMEAKVAELVEFGNDCWYNVYAGTISVDEEGRAYLASLGNHNHYFPEEFLVQLIEPSQELQGV